MSCRQLGGNPTLCQVQQYGPMYGTPRSNFSAPMDYQDPCLPASAPSMAPAMAPGELNQSSPINMKALVWQHHFSHFPWARLTPSQAHVRQVPPWSQINPHESPDVSSATWKVAYCSLAARGAWCAMA